MLLLLLLAPVVLPFLFWILGAMSGFDADAHSESPVCHRASAVLQILMFLLLNSIDHFSL